MKKQLFLVFSVLFLSSFASLNQERVFASTDKDITIIDDNFLEKNKLKDTVDTIKFNPVTVNYILEGANIKIKSSKELNNIEDFWADYTVKFSNKLMYGNIDTQEVIRDYHFSHYEIDGKRIESIDSIISFPIDSINPIVNIIYSESIQSDGYLRKGFRDGIALDFSYIEQSSINDTFSVTDLYDDTWQLYISADLNKEISEKYSNQINANDKTLYFKVDAEIISSREQSDLSKNFHYIDSIKIENSLEYKDTENPFILTYKPKDKLVDYKDKHITLYGINLEGKIEPLSKSQFKDNIASFSLNKSFNKYQYFFIAIEKEKEAVVQDTDKTATNITNQSKPNTIADKDSLSSKIPNVSPENNNGSESKLVLLISACFSLGALSTFLLSLVLSLRDDNIRKKKENKENEEEN